MDHYPMTLAALGRIANGLPFDAQCVTQYEFDPGEADAAAPAVSAEGAQ